jgi:hypothetical protein
MFIYEVCNALNQAKIPYAVVGGYAVALHGAVRGTIDVDIVTEWTLKNLQHIETTLKELGLVSSLPVDALSVFHFREEYIQKRNMIAWNFYDPKNPIRQIDLIINYDLKMASTKTVATNTGKLKILSRADLIEMKKKSGRPQDLEDVRALERL